MIICMCLILSNYHSLQVFRHCSMSRFKMNIIAILSVAVACGLAREIVSTQKEPTFNGTVLGKLKNTVATSLRLSARNGSAALQQPFLFSCTLEVKSTEPGDSCSGWVDSNGNRKQSIPPSCFTSLRTASMYGRLSYQLQTTAERASSLQCHPALSGFFLEPWRHP